MLHGWAVAGTDLRALDVSSADDGATVTLELSAGTSYSLFTLKHPDRVVLDLRDTRKPRGVRTPPPAGVIEAIRTGARPQGALRLVLQLKSALPASAEWSAGQGSRLVLRVGAGKPAPDPVPVRPPTVHALHAPTVSDRNVVIAVDAGHGGQDPGATGHYGTHEKDVVLAIARALARRINAEPGMRAVLTRDQDTFVTLRERIHRARLAKADLFVSVHADSIHNPEVSGSSVYVLSERGATDESARWLAERENAADLMGGVSLSDKDSTLASVLLDLSQSANISTSMVAAERVLNALENVGEIRKPHVQQAGFVVLKSPDIPSMLVETAYISNPGEERRLRLNAHQNKLASAIFSGLRTYFERNPPPGTRFAQAARGSGITAVLAGSPPAPPATTP